MGKVVAGVFVDEPHQLDWVIVLSAAELVDDAQVLRVSKCDVMSNIVVVVDGDVVAVLVAECWQGKCGDI